MSCTKSFFSVKHVKGNQTLLLRKVVSLVEFLFRKIQPWIINMTNWWFNCVLYRQYYYKVAKPSRNLRLISPFFTRGYNSTSFGEVLYANVSLLRNRKFDLISQSGWIITTQLRKLWLPVRVVVRRHCCMSLFNILRVRSIDCIPE